MQIDSHIRTQVTSGILPVQAIGVTYSIHTAQIDSRIEPTCPRLNWVVRVHFRLARCCNNGWAHKAYLDIGQGNIHIARLVRRVCSLFHSNSKHTSRRRFAFGLESMGCQSIIVHFVQSMSDSLTIPELGAQRIMVVTVCRFAWSLEVDAMPCNAMHDFDS